MIPDHANPARAPRRIGQPERLPTVKRACNRHHDCDAVDRIAKALAEPTPEHCHVDFCEDCFGQ